MIFRRKCAQLCHKKKQKRIFEHGKSVINDEIITNYYENITVSNEI